MARDAGKDKDRNINIKDGGSENIAGKGMVVQSLQPILDEVHGILVRKQMLLREINKNYEALEDGGLDHNFTLMGEIHNNMGYVINIYLDLSSSFSCSLSKGSPDVVDGTKGGCKKGATSE